MSIIRPCFLCDKMTERATMHEVDAVLICPECYDNRQAKPLSTKPRSFTLSPELVNQIVEHELAQRALRQQELRARAVSLLKYGDMTEDEINQVLLP